MKLYQRLGYEKKQPPRGAYSYSSHWEEKERKRMLWNAIGLLALALFGAILLGILLIGVTPMAVAPQ